MKAACTGTPAWRRLRIQPTTVDPVVQISSITITKGEREEEQEDGTDNNEDEEDDEDDDNNDNNDDNDNEDAADTAGEDDAFTSNTDCNWRRLI